MKLMKNVFVAIGIILATIVGCSKNDFEPENRDISGQNDTIPEEPEDTIVVELGLKEKLVGKWYVASDDPDFDYWSWAIFSENDTIYESSMSLIGDIFYSAYKVISEDSILVDRIHHYWNQNIPTHNKVIFHTEDSMTIEGYGIAGLHIAPPIVCDVTFIRDK